MEKKTGGKVRNHEREKRGSDVIGVGIEQERERERERVREGRVQL